MTPFRIAAYALAFGAVLCGFVVLARAQGYEPRQGPLCLPTAQLLGNLQLSFSEFPILHLKDRGTELIVTRAGRACLMASGLTSRFNVGT